MSKGSNLWSSFLYGAIGNDLSGEKKVDMRRTHLARPQTDKRQLVSKESRLKAAKSF